MSVCHVRTSSPHQDQNNSLFNSIFANYLGHLYRTFDPLPQSGKVVEVIKRIVMVVSSVALFPLLATFSGVERMWCKSNITNSVQKEAAAQLPIPSTPKANDERKPPQPIQISHYDTIAFDGYDSGRLEAIQTEIDQKNIPLHVCPKRPENVNPVNFAKANAYLSSLPPSYQPTFRKLWENNFLYISMCDFDEQLKHCVQRFNAMIEGQNYFVGLASGKSSQWVASLALKDLKTLPTSWFTLGRQNTNPVAGYRIHTPEEKLTVPEDENIPLAIFDDGGYSGTQLSETLCKIARATKVKRTIYLIVPYVSERALKNITIDYQRSSEDQGKLNVILITSEQRIPWAGDNLTKDEMYLMHELVPSLSFKGIDTFLCVTDWRIPDNIPSGFGKWSMRNVVEGHVECDGCQTCEIKKDEYFIASSWDVPRPYALSASS